MSENKEKYFTKNIFKEMARVINEIRLDFENEEETIAIFEKSRLLKEVRNDLMEIFWNYELNTKRFKEKYDNKKQNN